jgi:hypothetical protein
MAVPRAVLHALGLVVAVAALQGCAQVVQYTDELRDDRTGRTVFVRSPATVGGIAGFAIGAPVSVVALPVTWGVYRYQKSTTPLQADPTSTLLFPSFLFWRVGTLLLGAPFDALEWGLWRAWREAPSLNAAEREAIELRHDEAVLASYPVEPIYPLLDSRASR